MYQELHSSFTDIARFSPKWNAVLSKMLPQTKASKKLMNASCILCCALFTKNVCFSWQVDWRHSHCGYHRPCRVASPYVSKKEDQETQTKVGFCRTKQNVVLISICLCSSCKMCSRLRFCLVLCLFSGCPPCKGLPVKLAELQMQVRAAEHSREVRLQDTSIVLP